MTEKANQEVTIMNSMVAAYQLKDLLKALKKNQLSTPRLSSPFLFTRGLGAAIE